LFVCLFFIFLFFFIQLLQNFVRPSVSHVMVISHHAPPAGSNSAHTAHAQIVDVIFQEVDTPVHTCEEGKTSNRVLLIF